MMRYVIVGSGVAGIAAIEAIRSLDDQGEIWLIHEDPHGFYSRPGLAYYLTDEIPEEQLFPASIDWKRYRVQRLWGRVTRLYPEQSAIEGVHFRLARSIFGSKKVQEEAFRLSYDRLLLAVGSQAIPLNIPGTESQGVVKIDHLDDARRIRLLARRSRKAVVVGGGITSLELVEGLRAQGVEVHYLMRGERYWSNVLDETESRIVEHRLEEEGVILHHFTEVSEILAQKGRVVGVRLKDGQVLRCDMVAYAIGVRPRLELARQASLQTDRGILVNEYLQTSVPDIFAAGDVAQVYDPRSGKAMLDSLWGPAREQGYYAGLNMAGLKRPYLRGVPFNVTRLAGITTTLIGRIGEGRDEDTLGIVRGDSETWRDLPDALMAQSGFDVNRIRLIIGERTLLGAVVMGDQTLSFPLQRMIAEEVDIRPIRDRLLSANEKPAEVLAEYWSKLTTSTAPSLGRPVFKFSRA
jgi:NAD(P)H-nitrite reductase large subunit